MVEFEQYLHGVVSPSPIASNAARQLLAMARGRVSAGVVGGLVVSVIVFIL
jgi:hypothetical protein